MPPVIRVDNLSKCYRLGLTHDRSVRDLINRWTDGLLRRNQTHPALNGKARGPVPNKKDSTQEFWALRDVSFEVQPGEVVGIIGRNGAGKSTLLKILSRITKPTSGRVEMRGRVASLLEVGTGFHPELTGRENVYMNGTVLGMTKREIDRRFDEIVAFAEVEKFIDTPVKRYSSGMTVRLGFAVAAHLEPEILIVDEVLAVGDLSFQQKCITAMSSIAHVGRTVLFVSHNMASVRRLCSRAILMHDGCPLIDGTLSEAIDKYVSNTSTNVTAQTLDFRAHQSILGHATFIEMTTLNGQAATTFGPTETWNVKIRFKINHALENFVAALGLQSTAGTPVLTTWSAPQRIEPGEYVATFTQDTIWLSYGTYELTIGLSNNYSTFDYVTSAITFQIVNRESHSKTSWADNRNDRDLLLNQMKCTISEIK